MLIMKYSVSLLLLISFTKPKTLLKSFTGPYAGGVRGGSDEPPFLAGYTYYVCDRLTLDDWLSSKGDGWRSAAARV